MSLRGLFLDLKLNFDTPEEAAASEDFVVRAHGLVARHNLMYLQQHPETPMLYDSGVVYTQPDQADGRPPLKKKDLADLLALIRKIGLDPETALLIVRLVRGMEICLDVPSLYRRGKGDCNELVPVRIAELWRAGVAATPWLQFEGENVKGGKSYHLVVRHPDGSSEDPSGILGMSSAAYRREECRKNAERYYIAAQQGLPADEMGLVPKDGVFRLHHSGSAPTGAQPKIIDASEWAQVSGRYRALRAA